MSETEYRLDVCPECKVREEDPSEKKLFQCRYCERWFCERHVKPRLTVIRDFKTVIKDTTWGNMIEKEWRRKDGHPDFAYTWERFEELKIERAIIGAKLEALLDKSKAYRKLTPQSPRIVERKTEKRARELGEIKKPRIRKGIHIKVKINILRRRIFFVIVGLALLIGSDFYGKWQLGEARLWENTFIMIFSPSGGPKTSAIFSGLMWGLTILIVLPCLFGWGAFKFLYRPITVYEWEFLGKRKAYVKAYNHVERSFGPGVFPFLVGFFGQVVLGYLLGLAIPLSITMPLGSILLSIGCFGLLLKLRRRS